MRFWTEEDDKRCREEREFQIALAEFQADIQVNLSMSLGYFAALITLVTFFAQWLFSTPLEQTNVRALIFGGMLVFGIIFILLISKRVDNLKATKKKISELRKQYIG